MSDLKEKYQNYGNLSDAEMRKKIIEVMESLDNRAVRFIYYFLIGIDSPDETGGEQDDDE